MEGKQTTHREITEQKRFWDKQEHYAFEEETNIYPQRM